MPPFSSRLNPFDRLAVRQSTAFTYDPEEFREELLQFGFNEEAADAEVKLLLEYKERIRPKPLVLEDEGAFDADQSHPLARAVSRIKKRSTVDG